MHYIVQSVMQFAVNPYNPNASPLPHACGAGGCGSPKVVVIFNVIFGILGALSLLMVTIGGFRYVMSHGDPQAAARAKGTILYALLGLVVCISAVAIVTFVLGRL